MRNKFGFVAFLQQKETDTLTMNRKRQGLVAKVEARSASGRPIRKDSPLHLVW